MILALWSRLGLVEIFLVERSDPVCSDFRVINLSNSVRGERAESH
jgi:hypothetical protein